MEMGQFNGLVWKMDMQTSDKKHALLVELGTLRCSVSVLAEAG